ncbi:uncharacterized protein MELLADRAFT_77864 [Melampsora larici-populina 98AG31]|uniref:Paf1 complex protein n=1 Tax=Melampsora larici-populina (strain 98AG31 / pathotype 3-4-7) TaxID=747676 RepID=F4RMR2_MELLP|nr:uncharacterized protein MELLADRAFT_77864 [Melampsora larici-populina 98AG31]EGG06334.1 hypothetical protein MELLADRAFT_77864 [Melampsora larici-populina 98AG31]
MSSKKSTASPLLIRQRYPNPFPPPPFPPKLLHIPTDPARYAGYRFLAHLENEREIPILVDADLGMTIELGIESDGTFGLGTYWEGDRKVICHDSSPSKTELHPDDCALLVDPAPVQGASISIINGAGQNPAVSSIHASHHVPVPKGSPLFTTPSGANRKVDVAWLRRTEYFNETQQKPREGSAQKGRQHEPIVPKTQAERLADIHASFETIQQPIESLKHPTKPHLKAVDSFEFMPNESIWANTCDFYRFQENPTDHKEVLSNPLLEQVDPRLDHAILRPVPPIQADSRLAYYLSDDLENVHRYKKLKLETKTVDEGVLDPVSDPNPEPDEQAHNLHFVREYEVSQQRDLDQYLLVFDDGKSGHAKAAYFNPIAQSRTLRKRRPRMYGQPPVDDLGDPLWDGISVVLNEDPASIASARVTRNQLLDEVREPPPEMQLTKGSNQDGASSPKADEAGD